jgi:fructose-bisphosphate aldolase, class I
MNIDRTLPITGRDGRALVIAMDHGRTGGVTPGLEHPGRVIEQAIAGGADAIMASFGILKHERANWAGAVPTILRVDGGVSLYRRDWLDYDEWRLMYDVDDALALGCAGVVTMAFMGSPSELDTLEVTATVAAQAASTALTLMVEALPCTCERIPDRMAPEAMASAARLAYEHGADVIKNYYTGSVASFQTVVESTPAPMLIAGGVPMADARAVLTVVRDALAAGARGAVIGRNVWQHRDPEGMVRALARLIHDGIAVDEALAEVRE